MLSLGANANSNDSAAVSRAAAGIVPDRGGRKYAVIEAGTKLHAVERRLFEGDVRRHFLGEVVRSSDHAMIVRGWVFVYDDASAAFQRQPELRTRVISLVDARILVNILPESADLEKTVYEVGERGSLTVTDGENFRLAMSEFGFRR